MQEFLVAVLVLFGVFIPVIPVVLWHIGKGIMDDVKRWKRGNRA